MTELTERVSAVLDSKARALGGRCTVSGEDGGCTVLLVRMDGSAKAYRVDDPYSALDLWDELKDEIGRKAAKVQYDVGMLTDVPGTGMPLPRLLAVLDIGGM